MAVLATNPWHWQIVETSTAPCAASGTCAWSLSICACGDGPDLTPNFFRNRPLLFRETSKLADEDLSLEKSGLSPLIVLHHIFVRSPLPLPHELHGWQRAEYVRWIEAHDLEAALGLVRGVVDEWKARDEEAPQAQQFVQLIKTRLDKTL